MKNTLLLLFLLSTLFAFNQEVQYFDADWEICKKQEAKYYRETTVSSSGLYLIHDYYMNGNIQMKGVYSDKKLENEEGLFEYFSENGDTTLVENFKNGQEHGVFKRFFDGGEIESITNYIDGHKSGKYIEYFESGVIRGEADYIKGNIRGTAKKYYPNGNIGSILILDNLGTGTITSYFETGEKFCQGFYTKGYAADNWTTYNLDGSIKEINFKEESIVHERLLHSISIEKDKKRKEAFEKTVYIDGAVSDFIRGREIPMELPISLSDEIVEFPDVEATYPGGPTAMQQFIVDHVNYPKKAIKKNIGSRTYISFIVEADGSLSNVKYELGHEYFEDEAVRLVKSMPKWSPGEAKGKKARTRCRLPINFTLN